jgi:hypothetical protein
MKNVSPFSRLVAGITGMWKRIFRQDAEEHPSPPADDSEMSLLGSKWEFGCSAGAAQEIAGHYDEPKYPAFNGTVAEVDFLPWEKIDDNTGAQSSKDHWVHRGDDKPDPYQ